MTYVRANKWAPLCDPTPESRKGPEYIRSLQRALTMAYWNEGAGSPMQRKIAGMGREKVSAELIHQANLPRN